MNSTFSSLMKQMLIKFSQKRNGWQKLIHAEAQKLDYIRERENAKKEVSQNESTMANSKEMRQALRRRNIEEATLIYQIENLNAILVSESQKGESMVKMIKEAHSELRKQFETCNEVHNRQVSLVDFELPKEEINWIASHMNKLSQININSNNFK